MRRAIEAWHNENVGGQAILPVPQPLKRNAFLLVAAVVGLGDGVGTVVMQVLTRSTPFHGSYPMSLCQFSPFAWPSSSFRLPPDV